MLDSDTKKFMIELYEALNDQTQKYLGRHAKKKDDPEAVLCAMQNTAANYLTKATQSIIDPFDSIVEKLDHIERVRSHINDLLDHLKTKVKSVSLN